MTPAATPWERRDQTFFAAAGVLGLTVIVIAWYGSSTRYTAADGWIWFNVGLGGLALAGIGNVVYFLRGRRAVGIARALILPGVVTGDGPAPVLVAAEVTPLVSGPGMSRFHRPDCTFAAGRGVEAAPLGSLLDAGLRACEVCEP